MNFVAIDFETTGYLPGCENVPWQLGAVIVEDGKIAEKGKPSKLLAEKGVYHKLFTLQAEAFRTIGIGE
jgi:DNA polymerase III epsilon subunit-like protein